MGPDFLSRLLASFFVNVSNDDFRPFVDEALRRFLADVTYSPSDDDSLSLKSIRHMSLHSLALWNKCRSYERQIERACSAAHKSLYGCERIGRAWPCRCARATTGACVGAFGLR